MGQIDNTDQGEKKESKDEVLLRQIMNKVQQEGDHTNSGVAVPFSKLLGEATGGEKCQIFIGWIFACFSGGILPLFFFYIGPVFDSFKE